METQTRITSIPALRFPVIETELVRNNLTLSIISRLREECNVLTIAGITDRKGYREVRAARVKCKSLRILTKKICLQGRRDALNEQRAWIAKEKEITRMITEIEKPLTEKYRLIDQEREKIRKEEEKREAERIQKRIDRLTPYTATIDFAAVKTLSDTDFETLVASTKELYETAQALIAKATADAEAERQRLKDENKQQKETIGVLKAAANKTVQPVEEKIAESPVPVPLQQVLTTDGFRLLLDGLLEFTLTEFLRNNTEEDGERITIVDLREVLSLAVGDETICGTIRVKRIN